MTFSIIAFDPAVGCLGIAVTTKNLAVGAVGYQARSRVGIIATQADPHPIAGFNGLELLNKGVDPGRVLEFILRDDQNRDRRQIHLVNYRGQAAAWTGQSCVGYAGHLVYQSFSIAGNMLVGKETLDAMADSYQRDVEFNLPERLLRALEAGQAAGGDKRGRQSAALYLISTEIYADLDLRVDDDPDPIAELRHLYEEAKKPYYANFRATFPTLANPSGVYDAEEIKQIVKQRAKLGY